MKDLRRIREGEPGRKTFPVIFTDLDATLLDGQSYRWDAAGPALARCRDLKVPVVLVSSKTRAEMDLLRKQMQLTCPFVSENGGGLFFPIETNQQRPPGAEREEGLWKISFGTEYGKLCEALRSIRSDLGVKIRGFSEMNRQEIAALTGLDLFAAGLAACREFDEPFIVEDRNPGDAEALRRAAGKRGLRVSAGGRFYHLHGENDKGRAVSVLIRWYRKDHRRLFTMALGDSENDDPMLERVNHPVYCGVVPGGHPRWKSAPVPGPAGWNAAVLEMLAEKIEKKRMQNSE